MSQNVHPQSCYHKPSKVNEAAFERAVEEVAEATKRLLEDIIILV